MVGEPDDNLRVSDAERDEVLKALGEHAGAGRLTLDELEDRSGQVLAAKTRGDLAAITRDLPGESGRPAAVAAAAAAAATAAATERRPVRWMVAILGGAHRRGRFRAAGEINAVSILGGDDIDLRDAEIEGGELILNVVSILGGPNIYVPDTIEVDVTGVSIMGGNTERGPMRPPRLGAPVVRIRTFNVMGGANIFRLPPQARGVSLTRARRIAKAAQRGELGQAGLAWRGQSPPAVQDHLGGAGWRCSQPRRCAR
jgi:hypothetical protein